jgi:peptidyl-prolyl cis-trans isomerase SurA
MRWHGWLGLSLVATLALGGCQSAPPTRTARGPDLPDPLADPQVPTQARAQKADHAVAVSVLDQGLRPTGGKGSRLARIRAVVNGEPILDEEVIAAGYQGLLTAHTDAERAEVINAKLNEIIDREVVLQDLYARLKGKEKFLKQLEDAARKEFDEQWLRKMMQGNKFTDEEAFKKFLRQHNMPLELIRRQWERNFMALEYLRHRMEPHLAQIGHAQIVDYYDRHPEEFHVADSVQWQDLFIAVSAHPSRDAARQFALSLAERARKGEDFVRLARQYDDGVSGRRDGAEGEGHKRGEVRPAEAEPILFRLKDGEVGFLELDTGFHVVRLVKRQHAGRMPFDETVQKQIRDKLRNQVFQREMKRLVDGLKRRAVIEIATDKE